MAHHNKVVYMGYDDISRINSIYTCNGMSLQFRTINGVEVTLLGYEQYYFYIWNVTQDLQYQHLHPIYFSDCERFVYFKRNINDNIDVIKQEIMRYAPNASIYEVCNPSSDDIKTILLETIHGR